MRRLRLLWLILVIAVPPPAAATGALEDHDCFSDDNSRRIAGCTALIEGGGSSPEILSAAYAMRALALSLKTQYDRAIRDYDAAIRLAPNFAVALNNRAWAYFKSRRAATGLADVEKSLQLDPASPHAYDTRAHIRQWTGEEDGALKDYDAAMRFGGARMIKLYQCGLALHGLYRGPADGIYSMALRRAMRTCVATPDCDPLPPDEDCRQPTS